VFCMQSFTHVDIMTDDLFPALRSLLCLPPNQRHFKDILTLLLGAETEHQDTLFDYAQTHLADWSPIHRALSTRDALFRDNDTHTQPFQLVRSFCFDESWPNKSKVKKILHLPITHLQLHFITESGNKSLASCFKKFSDTFLKQIEDLELLHIHKQDTNDPHPAIFSLFSRGCFENLHRLRFDSGILKAEHLQELLGFQGVQNLQVLSLCDNAPGVEGIEALANTPFQHLKELYLEAAGLDATCMGILVQAPFFPQLKKLDLYNNYSSGERGIRDEGVIAFSEGLKNTDCSLEELSFGNCSLTDKSAQALAEVDGLSGLTQLDLSTNDIGADGFQAIASSPSFSSLKRLDLQSTRPSEDSLKVLLSSSTLTQLETLNLYDSHVQDAHLLGLEDMEQHLPKLHSLDVSNNQISTKGLIALSQAPQLSTIRDLDLGNNAIDDEGLKALLSSPHLESLTSLRLNWASITNEGLQALTQSPKLSQLTILSITGCNIDNEGIKMLATSPHMANIEHLFATSTNLNDGCIEDLLNASFAGSLQYLSISNISRENASKLENSDRFVNLWRVELL